MAKKFEGIPPLFVRKLKLSGTPEQNQEILGTLVASLRRRAQKTQTELSGDLDITQARIAQLESKSGEPITVQRLVEIARACGFDVHIEFTEREPGTPQE